MSPYRILYKSFLSLLLALVVFYFKDGRTGGASQELNNIAYIAVGLTGFLLGITNALLEVNILGVGISAAICGYVYAFMAAIAAIILGKFRSIEDLARYPLTFQEWQTISLLAGILALLSCLLPSAILWAKKRFAQDNTTHV